MTNQAKRKVCNTFTASYTKVNKFLLEKSTSTHAVEKLTGTNLIYGYPTDTPPVFIPSSDTTGHIANTLVAAIHLSFTQHVPLSLSPDVIWYTITQGVAQIINDNADKFKSKFVDFEGKKDIIIRRDQFVRQDGTNPNVNDWSTVINEFSDQIKENIGEKNHTMIVANFSTTGVNERIVSEVVLMDAMKNYFEYYTRTMCGIPSISLEGTVNDWRSIRTRAEQFREFDSKWIDNLLPVLDQFVDAASKKVDRSFWESIYKYNGGSGGYTVSGWIKNFFPDIYQLGRITTNDFKTCVSRAPVTWQYYSETFKLQFMSGFIGISQDSDTYTIRPELSWAVVAPSDR
jgi:hypothetical protein